MQNDLLNSQEYNFGRRTFLPSTFAKKDIVEGQTLVVCGVYQEYFEKILDDILREIHKGRAVLIVFADEKKLRKFSDTINKNQPSLPQYKDPLELTDKLSNNDRSSIIEKVRTY